jgi:hypothetical protein
VSNGNIVQRVNDLIRLAVDAGASEHEARTAAFQAVRLLAKHGLRVVEARDTSTTTASTTTTQTTTRTTNTTSAWQSPWPPPRSHYDHARPSSDTWPPEAPTYPWVAQESQECCSCGATIAAGADCYYGPYPTHTWRCVPCAQRNAPPRRRSKRKKAKTGKA